MAPGPVPRQHGTVSETGARRWVVGISGASGTGYARSVLNGLLDAGDRVDLIISAAARLTLIDEAGVRFRDGHAAEDLAGWLRREPPPHSVRFWPPTNLAGGPASGSYPTHGMVVVPASVGAVAGIATGLSKDLLQRAADVTMKERRPLVVVPRETPLSRPTLVQLLALHDAGATVLPASPAFYAGATSVEQLVDFVAGRILDVLQVRHDLYRRWQGTLGGARGNGSGAATAAPESPLAPPDSSTPPHRAEPHGQGSEN